MMNYETWDRIAVWLAIYFVSAIPAWTILYTVFSVLALIARGPKYAKMVLSFPLRRLSTPEYTSYDGDREDIVEVISMAIMLWPLMAASRAIHLTKSFIRLLQYKP